MSKTFLFQAFQFYQTVLFQTIHFSIVFAYKQLNVKTVQLNLKKVLFQTIQFTISMLFSSIWPIDWTLSGATTPGQSVPGNNGNKGVLHIPQSSSITETLPSDCLVSYSGHSLGRSYPSAEKQSVLSTTPANWATVYLYIYLFR